ncbi:hypothetical protein E2542_SST28583 [Spatholobus suberectus]|nr:hypothetical protein E2542_SST28583 [Spatholobus suberectus]
MAARPTTSNIHLASSAQPPLTSQPTQLPSTSQPALPTSTTSCGLVKPTRNNLDMAWWWNSL